MSDSSAQDCNSNAGFDSDQDVGSDSEMAAGYSDQEDQFEFPDPQLSQSENKLPTYNYECLSLNDIHRIKKELVDDVAALLGLKESDSELLLRQYSWKRGKLTDEFLEDSNKVLTESGIPPSKSTVKNSSRIQQLPDFECQVCFSTSADVGTGRRPKMPTFALSCGHRYCTECYGNYLESKIGDGELNIACIDEDCNLKMEEDSLKMLIDESLFDRYKRLLTLSFVQQSLKDTKWCPGPDCANAIKCDVSNSTLDVLVPEVECKCQLSFCFGCGEEPHQPAICALVQKWDKKMRDDSETAKWIQTNTKACPPPKGCGKSIEKNGGCQHMTCKQCLYEWCWICLGDWKTHISNYSCNRFVPSDALKENSKHSLARYLHYFDRFTNHAKSAKLDLEFSERSEEKMSSIQEASGLKWIETRYIDKGVKTVIQARHTLKWSYCFAFYLKRDNMTELYEDNQRDLERATEELSELLEKPIELETIPTLRTEITNLSNYVATRRKIILEDAAQGLYEDRLKWENRI